MGILTKITNVAGGSIGKAVREILDEVITNKEERVKAEAELTRALADREKNIIAGQIESYKADIESLKSAHQMQIEAIKSGDKFTGRFVYVFALIMLVAVLAYSFSLLFIVIPPENRESAARMEGVLVASCFVSIIQYFFGSSRGSAELRQILKQTQSHANNTNNTNK